MTFNIIPTNGFSFITLYTSTFIFYYITNKSDDQQYSSPKWAFIVW